MQSLLTLASYTIFIQVDVKVILHALYTQFSLSRMSAPRYRAIKPTSGLQRMIIKPEVGHHANTITGSIVTPIIYHSGESDFTAQQRL